MGLFSEEIVIETPYSREHLINLLKKNIPESYVFGIGSKWRKQNPNGPYYYGKIHSSYICVTKVTDGSEGRAVGFDHTLEMFGKFQKTEKGCNIVITKNIFRGNLDIISDFKIMLGLG